MTESALRKHIGTWVIVGHVLILLLVFVFFITDGLLAEEALTTVAIVSPIFGAYVSTIVKHVLAHESDGKQNELSVPELRARIYLIFPLVFMGLVAILITVKAFNYGFASFAQFEIALLLTEIAFGVYTGPVLSALFPEKIARRGRPERM